MVVLASVAAWNITTQHLPKILQKITCQFGHSEVDQAVLVQDQFEIITLNHYWGGLWKQNTTFWDAIGHFWWALGTTQVSFSWTQKNTSCWPQDFNETLASLAVENIHLKESNIKAQSALGGCEEEQ